MKPVNSFVSNRVIPFAPPYLRRYSDDLEKAYYSKIMWLPSSQPLVRKPHANLKCIVTQQTTIRLKPYIQERQEHVEQLFLLWTNSVDERTKGFKFIVAYFYVTLLKVVECDYCILVG